MKRNSAGASRISGEQRKGRIVANFGRRLLVEDTDGERWQALPRGRKLGAVCGDAVHWLPDTSKGTAQVLEVLPRTTELKRPDTRGRISVLAANFSQLVAVAAPVPETDAFVVDRYLAAAALIPCRALLVINKIDLVAELPTALVKLEVELAGAGYDVLRCSAKTGDGMSELSTALAAHTSILVGQSGVGKSSLLNTLIPNLEAATAAVSEATGEGRHTTTAAMLHGLPAGGDIIDSPGVRDYAPPPVPAREVDAGYIEFADAGRCRFADCLHLKEPDCAVKEAVADGRIAPRRYESYRRLFRLMNELRSSP